MLIIAESGATKTHWCSVSSDGVIRRAQTCGLNPLVSSEDVLMKAVGTAVPSLNPEGVRVDRVCFYGAGFVDGAVSMNFMDLLRMWCPFAQIELHTDMEAAGRALFGDGCGVVAILGTGSNSCLWENGRIVSNIRPGGFILGDEGSGASLGRMFIADYIKGLVPEDMESEFESLYGLDYPSIVSRVYKADAPSRFLASFAEFVCGWKMRSDYASALIERNMEDFMERSLVRYGRKEVGVVGSFGCACREELIDIGERYGLVFTRFIKAPIDELVKYHTNVI